MAKISASILVLLALFAFVGAEQFQTLNFDQGTLRFRSLDTASSLKSFATVNYTNLTAVNVDLGSPYTTKAGIDTTKTPTDMILALYHSTTGFCTGCSEVVNFKCEDNSCDADKTKPQRTSGTHPYYSVDSGYPFTLGVTIGTDASSWKLKSSALLYSSSSHSYFQYPGSSYVNYYIENKNTFGFIGMGVDGESAKNFAGDHPLFSINVTGAGTGKLIFGKDTSLIDSSKGSISLTTSTNWTMSAKNISLGATVHWKPFPTTYGSYPADANIIFDVNFPGLGLPENYIMSDLITNLTTLHNPATTTTTTAEKKILNDQATYQNNQYPYIYKGDITQLSNIVIGLSNGQNFTISPQAYTRKIADGVYNILIQRTPQVWNSETKTYNNWVILGSSVMSNYYTVFEKTATGNPTVTLYPNFAGYGTSGNTTTTASSWKTILIVVVVVLVALVVLSLAFKKKNNFTKSDLGVELRAARV